MSNPAVAAHVLAAFGPAHAAALIWLTAQAYGRVGGHYAALRLRLTLSAAHMMRGVQQPDPASPTET